MNFRMRMVDIEVEGDDEVVGAAVGALASVLRDPRRDPSAGDVLRLGNVERDVIAGANGVVIYRTSWRARHPSTGRERTMGRTVRTSLAAWRRWAGRAAVKRTGR